MPRSLYTAAVLFVWGATAALAAPDVEFNRDVRPVLSDRCFACHGPDPGNRKAGLRLDMEAGAKSASASKRIPVVPGDPEKSELFRRVTSESKALRMPPAYAGHDRLTDREIDLLRRWILQGAKWQGHWSFLAPARPALPEVRNASWPRNPIDRFVLARLDREGLTPSPEADRNTLLRRVTLDLTGLPPAPAEVDAFLADRSPDAYEKVVDRLLASPQHAERMAIRWLEAARYADTNGYQTDGERSMWRWRDWVIDAFRANMPFDRFTIEQIAGDLLPGATLDQKIATGFHRNHRTSGEGGIIPEEFRSEYVAERAETTSVVWLGLTAGCARCHDHKYDPITQKDFYRLFAFFNNLNEKGLVYNFGNEEPFIKAPTPEMSARLAALDRTLVAAEEQVRSLETKRAQAQSAWEKKLAKAKPFEWTVPDGLVFQQTLSAKISGCAAGAECALPLAEGKTGKAHVFDGTKFVDGGDVARFSYLDAFSLSAWIRPESPKGAILTKVEDYFEGQGYGIYLIDGKLRFHIIMRWTDIGLRVETEAPVELNRWTHVAATYDGTRKAENVRLYINGQRQKMKILFDDLNYPLGNKDSVKVGAGAGPDMRFRGLISDARIYRGALSEEQATTLPLVGPVNELAAIAPENRTPAQASKLALCFLDRAAPAAVRQARARRAAAKAERTKYFESIPTVMVMEEMPQPRDAFVLKRGAYDAPGEKVSAAVPSFLPPLPNGAPANRLGLAKWLVAPENPLVARVTVNRFWQTYFGVGLVKTVEDFGSQGEWPVHQELLDWLAVEFRESGWDMRKLQKTVVMSATYRQSSKPSPALLERDPENRLLARGPRIRLAPEIIRDQALAASGLLVNKLGGPSVKPYQPPGLWQELTGGKGYEADKGEGLYRRTLYTYWRRTIAPPSMVTFDSPNRETCAVRENRTNTPLQALNLMNDVAYLEASRKLAERMIAEGGKSGADRIRFGMRLVTGRNPNEKELSVLSSALDRFRTRFGGDSKRSLDFLSAGASPLPRKLDATELAAYASVASLLLNLDETVTKE